MDVVSSINRRQWYIFFITNGKLIESVLSVSCRNVRTSSVSAYFGAASAIGSDVDARSDRCWEDTLAIIPSEAGVQAHTGRIYCAAVAGERDPSAIVVVEERAVAAAVVMSPIAPSAVEGAWYFSLSFR